MTLHVQTAHFGYSGLDRLDITRGSPGTQRRPFAPSRRILGDALAARRRAAKVREGRYLLAKAAWDIYVPAYLDEMATSQRDNPGAWQALLGCEHIVLVCYCPKRERCHRGLLAELLVEMGAVDDGEIVAVAKQLELPV